jgi:hypothetical protein
LDRLADEGMTFHIPPNYVVAAIPAQ